MRIQPLIALWFATAVAAAQLPLFQGIPGGSGDVLVLAGVDQRPPELRGIELLPIECVGRTRLDELSNEACRRVTDVPGAARLALPREQGSLYRFRRRDDGGAAYGYFLVDRAGARLLFEQRGTGLAGTDDPLARRVSVARDGRALLVATSPAAGGDLYEIHLTRGVVNRTEDIDPQDFQRNGLLLLSDFGVAVSTQGVLRCARGPFDQVESVPLPSPRTWFGPDVVASADQSTVAFLSGQDESRALVFTCRASGSALQASEQAMEITGAGFLPEVEGGPWLALSSDGSFVAWCSEEETFAHQTGGGARPDTHLSGDATLESTLNDTGVLAFFDADSLLFAGGREGSDGVERADLFRIDLTRGSSSFAVSNLTRTSGQSQPPFDYGTLRAEDGIYLVPGANGSLLLHERRPDKHGFLRWVSPGGSVTTVFSNVESLDTLDVSGRFLAATVTRPVGVDDPLLARLSLLQIPRDGSAPSAMLLAPGSRMTRRVGSRAVDRFAGVLEFAGFEWIGRIVLPTSEGLHVSGPGLFFGPTTGQLADGSFVGTTSALGIPLVFRWSDVELSILRFGVPGFVLPGS